MASLSPRFPGVVFGAVAWAAVAGAALEPSPNNGDIILPDGFQAVIVADGQEGVRGLAVAPNGDVYARLRGNGIAALRDTDGDGAADRIERLPGEIGRGSGIAVQDGYLYYSTDAAVFRIPRAEGELVPTAA